MSLEPDGLANLMVGELPRAWRQVKGEPFPGGSTDDAKIMFLAVARGLLRYLESHQDDTITTIELTTTGIANRFNVPALDLDITVPA